MRPFEISIAKTAQKLLFEKLDDDQKQALARDINYDETYDIFKVIISPVFDINKAYSNRRQLRRLSFDKIDKCLVDIKLGDSSIDLLGIYPTTTSVHGQTSLDLEGELLFDTGIIKFQLKGKIKNSIRRNTFSIMSVRNPPTAQWIFFPSYIHQNTHFNTQILCLVPRTLDDKNKYITCKVVAKAGNRIIGNKIYESTVHLTKDQ